MMPRLLALLGVLSSLGAAPCTKSPEQATEKAVRFLIAQQSEDGGWHSETYGTMRQGAAITSHVLYAMGCAPREFTDPHAKELDAAYKFLRPGIRKTGHVSNADGTDDYPTYSTAMLLIASKQLKLKMPDNERRLLEKFLVSAQLTETRKFKPDNIHYGGWDFSGAQFVVGQTSGTNVSVTRFALEALRESELKSIAATHARAAGWVSRCQDLDGDGGFIFTPDFRAPGNKTVTLDEEEAGRPSSYGTVTCDGLLCLTFAGAMPMDKRVVAAADWLVKHPEIQVVPGFAGMPEANDWQEGLRFYYYAALAKALPHLPVDVASKRRAALLKHLVSLQRTDGSWHNPSRRMREDDPLICTSFALATLGELLRQQQRDKAE